MQADLVKRIKQQSVLIAQTIGARDICRIDYRVDVFNNTIFFIEINSAPRFSSSSEIGFIAEHRGVSFNDIIKIYLDTVLKRIKKQGK